MLESLSDDDPAKQDVADSIETRVRRWSVDVQFRGFDRTLNKGLTFGIASAGQPSPLRR